MSEPTEHSQVYWTDGSSEPYPLHIVGCSCGWLLSDPYGKKPCSDGKADFARHYEVATTQEHKQSSAATVECVCGWRPFVGDCLLPITDEEWEERKARPPTSKIEPTISEAEALAIHCEVTNRINASNV